MQKAISLFRFYLNIDAFDFKDPAPSFNSLLHRLIREGFGVVPSLPEYNRLARIAPSAIIYCVIVYFNNEVASSALPKDKGSTSPVFIMPNDPFVITPVHFVTPSYLVPEAGIEPARSTSERF